MDKSKMLKARWLAFKNAYLLEVERYKKQQRLIKMRKLAKASKEKEK